MRAALLARALQTAQKPQPDPNPEQTLSIFKVLDGLAKSRLELEREQMNHELKRLELEGAQKIKEIEAREAARVKRKALLEDMASNMRELRKKRGDKLGGGVLPTFIRTCEDCRAWLDGRAPSHTVDMFNHAKMRHQAQLEDMVKRGAIARANDAA
jgi:hypothetical protein